MSNPYGKTTKDILSDSRFLLALLSVLAKKNGGTLSFSTEELRLLKMTDLIAIYYDQDNDEYLIKVHDADAEPELKTQAMKEEFLSTDDSSFSKTSKEDEWEN